jgi:hypothetical protein
VEQLFKLTSFSLETSPSLSPAAYSKRRRFNMNVTPEDHHPNFHNQAGPPQNRGHDQRQTQSGGGRGRYNKNFRLTQCGNARVQQNLNPTSSLQSPNSATRSVPPFMDRTPPSIGSSMTIRPWSPMRGRVLTWDDL